jgi:N-acetylglucosaminyl-diphospho-decaprenol L-rhamnosyltransferase
LAAAAPTDPAGRFAVVIVSHGALDLLRSCLRSFETTVDAKPRRVTVVDSGSPDSTPAMVAREFPWVELTQRDNVGFAAANNLVLREPDSEFVLLLNPDTELRDGALEACLARMETDPAIGMVGCKLVLPSGELDHACKRSFPTPLSALAHFTGVGRSKSAPGRLSQYRATDLGEDQPGPVDAVNGAFMLVRSEAIRDVGLLDEGYWLYMEDLDWCYRFWRRGWTVFYEPAAIVLHVKGGTSGKRRGFRQEVAFHRGMGRFHRKFQAPRGSPLTAAAVYLGIGLKLLASLVRSVVSSSRARAFRRSAP